MPHSRGSGLLGVTSYVRSPCSRAGPKANLSAPDPTSSSCFSLLGRDQTKARAGSPRGLSKDPKQGRSLAGLGDRNKPGLPSALSWHIRAAHALTAAPDRAHGCKLRTREAHKLPKVAQLPPEPGDHAPPGRVPRGEVVVCLTGPHMGGKLARAPDQ